MGKEIWRQLSLGEVVTLQRGYDLPHKERKHGTVPIVSSSGITDTHNEARVTGPGVVTGRYGTIGEVFFVAEDFWPLNTTLFVKDFKGNNPLFISFLLCRIDYRSYSGKSGVPGVNRNDLHEISVDLPPLPEQHAIATALSDVDALIASLDKLIAKKRDIKQATMQQLLTGEMRLPGFNGRWEVKKLEDECELITKGTTPTSLGKLFSADGVNFVKVESLTEEGDIIQDKLAFIDEETHNLLRRSQLKNKDVLFSIAGALGRTAIVKQDILPANTNQALALIRLKDRSCLDHIFLTKYLTSPEITRHIGSINVQAAQANLSLEDIRNFEIRAPAITEQQAITTVLTDMDAEIAALEQKRDKTRVLKQGMMQELLTGKTRLL